MRPSQHELPGIWAAAARPERTVAASPRADRHIAQTARITTPWVREATSFLVTVLGGLTVLLGTMGLFFPSWLFAA